MIKPRPANRMEALPGGLGVMADDAMAALYGNLVMRWWLVAMMPAGWLVVKPPGDAGRPLITAAIIAVGSELLTPAKIDTNSLFITEQLNLLGIEVKAKAVVGDERASEHVFQAWLARADLVVFCGALVRPTMT